MTAVALNFPVLTMGFLLMGLGSWFRAIEASPWVQGNLAFVSDFFASVHIVSAGLQLAGAVIVGFGLFWGRWILATVFGLLFAALSFVVFLWPA